MTLGRRGTRTLKPRSTRLNAREIEVLRLGASGALLRDIAKEMNVPREYVSVYLSTAYVKLGIGKETPRNQKRARAVEIARARALIPKETT